MLKKVLLFVVSTGIFSMIFSAEPLIKVGIISDTHANSDISSYDILRGAMELFREKQVDMIANCGDIAGKFNPQAYINYRRTVDGVYAGKKMPPELFAFAWHDRTGGREKDPQQQVFEDVKKNLGIRHGLYHSVDLKGYKFLLFPQEVDFERCEKEISKAVSADPGKPVFIIDHVPPSGTVYNSLVWGDIKRREILEKFPQVIHISGHVHGTLTNELNIWQGKFTAVNAGSITVWRLPLTGNAPEVLSADMAMIMEVFPDKVIFRRYFISTGKEYRSDDAWVVTLPFDPAKAAYAPEKRFAGIKAPAFPSGSKASNRILPDKVEVTFPAAEHPDGVFIYRVSLWRKDGGKELCFAHNDVAGSFHLPVEKRPETHSFSLNPGYFSTPGSYRIEIRPEHFSGAVGKAIQTELTIRNVPALEVIYESRTPMNDLPYISGTPGRERLHAGKDGYYDNQIPDTRLEFPESVWQGKEGARFRFTMDVRMKQSGERSWNMMFRNDNPSLIVSGRISTPPGDSGSIRYVVDLYKFGDFHNYYLLICEGSGGKIRFEYVKIERLN